MKNSIFSKSFDDVFTTPRLLFELSQLKPQPKDVEVVKKAIHAGGFFDNAPKETFFIPKSDGSYRQVALSSTKTKIIQRVLSLELGYVMRFSDRSYAFRKGKSPFKAIARVRDALHRQEHIAKADIQNFFDTIEHDILIGKLKHIVKDSKIVHLIAYYLSQGSLSKNQWVDKSEGIYQGDVLSPLLSNIYLNDFDYYLESEGVMHVRYSDDMLFFGDTQEEASKARKLASEYLRRIGLAFNAKKTYLSHIDKGFEYLGVSFSGNSLSIDTVRLGKKIEKLKKESQKLSLEESVEKLNQKITGFKNYYAKFIDDDSQLNLLQITLEEIIVDKIVSAKQSKTINSKMQIKVILEPLKSYAQVHQRHWIDGLISQAYAKIALSTPLVSAQKRVANEKRAYLQSQIKSSEIVVSDVGAFLGFSQGKIKVKVKGKIVLEAPVNRVKRILLLNKQSSLSSYLIYECSKRKIDIDFIERSVPYAMLTYHHHVSPALHMVQLKNYFSPKGFEYAREVVHTKSRNQINLIKYLNRRRKNPILKEKIDLMQKLYLGIKTAKDKKSLMGVEGIISMQYWAAFGEVLGIEGFIRTHQNSKDELNQALNYGYAILYNRIQSALIHEGLNLYYPLYHSVQSNKPTLVYDMVEAFRQPVVDREILALLNRGQVLSQSNGRLSKASIKLIVQNIQERLATPAPSRFGKSPLYNIIGFQMNHLKRSMLDNTTYKGFVNKY
ncbi:Retron-type RNA-directed DNA polymerase [hydrothermal vent metagenome]|uniref:Retron-type RNA-directed DNA polymerase n=1 Tax=hydrothermal vent metagenome TaxID=652676 RepID=A0A1W1EEJ9_9ZZZZ